MTFCDAYSKHRESHYARPCFPEINLIDHNWLKLPNDKILNRLGLKMPFYNLAGKFVSRFLLTGAICAQLAEKARDTTADIAHRFQPNHATKL